MDGDTTDPGRALAQFAACASKIFRRSLRGATDRAHNPPGLNISRSTGDGMRTVLSEGQFLWGLGICLLLSLGLGWLSAHPWRKLDAAHAQKLRIEPFILAGNTGITVAGIGVPLIAALAAYAYSQLTQGPRDLAFLIAGLFATVLSVLAGLWAVFSLATIGGEQEFFEVHRDLNVYVGANLVVQLALLVFGTALVALYVINLDSGSRSASAAVAPAGPALIKRPLRAGESSVELDRAWGDADQTRQVDGAIVKTFSTQSSSFEIFIERGYIVQIIEKKK